MMAKTFWTMTGASPSDGSSSSSRRGLRHQAARHRDHLLLAARERPAERIREGPDVREEVEHLVRLGHRICAWRRALRLEAPSMMFSRDRQAREHAPALGHMGDARGARSPRGRARRSTGRRTGCRPAAGRTSPEIARSVVDLPAPFEPSSVTTSPGSTASDDALERLDLAVADHQVIEFKQGHAHLAGALDRSRDRRSITVRMSEHRAGLAVGDAASEIQHGDVLGHVADQGHVVVDDQDGEALARRCAAAGRAVPPSRSN